MILIDFPDSEPRPVDLDMICREMGVSNIMSLTRPDDEWLPDLQGTLSIKCAFGGVEYYRVDGRRIPVNDANYLIVNQGQRYSSMADATASVQSMCVFFRPGFAEGVLRDRITPDDLLLTDCPDTSANPLCFFDKLYPHDSTVSPMLGRIHTALLERTFTKGWLEEQYHILLLGMLDAHRDVLREIARLPAQRRSTRVEIYRRLARAREFMLSSYDRPISLTEIAREASLSPHHFLRLFKSLFSLTPHQYLTSIRIEQARRLLSTTKRSINDICFDLGFESPTSFSLLFNRHVGTSPRDYRLQTNAQKKST